MCVCVCVYPFLRDDPGVYHHSVPCPVYRNSLSADPFVLSAFPATRLMRLPLLARKLPLAPSLNSPVDNYPACIHICHATSELLEASTINRRAYNRLVR